MLEKFIFKNNKIKFMNKDRLNSLEPVRIIGWRWQSFLDKVVSELSSYSLDSYPIASKFLNNETSLGSSTNPLPVRTSTWACKFDKIRQARAACVYAKNIASVLNLVISPLPEFDLPFFGADFVTLPNFHLLALDLQPALINDSQHTKKVWDRLIPLHSKWSKFLPEGGAIPEDAKRFFSPGFLWTKIPLSNEGDQIISEILKPAFDEYLNLFLDLIIEANQVSFERSSVILKGQKEYIEYRAMKDPARSMLNRFYGSKWTEEYINNVLFDLK